MTMEWKGIWRHWFGRPEIKRRCPIDGSEMDSDSNGVLHCWANGHTIEPNKKSPIDDLTKASKGHSSGEI